MREKITTDFCENDEEVLSADIVWTIWLRIINKMDKYSTRYYGEIISRLKNQEEISLQQYSDIIDLLKSEEFVSEAAKFYSKTKINIGLDTIFTEDDVIETDNLSHLAFSNIFVLVENRIVESLIKNLSTDGEPWELYSMLWKRYICIKDKNGEKNICKIIEEAKTTKWTVFFVEFVDKKKTIVTEIGETIIPIGNFETISYDKCLDAFLVSQKIEEENIVYGFLDLEWNEIYGWCKWEKVWVKVTSQGGKYYHIVWDQDKIWLVTRDGEEIYWWCKWLEIKSLLSTPSGEKLCIVKDFNGLVWLVRKDGEEIYGWCKWDAIISVLEDEENNTYANVSKNWLQWLVTKDGEEVYGWCKWEKVKSYILSFNGTERYWEMVQNEYDTPFIPDESWLVDKEGNKVYGEKWSKIKWFVSAPDGVVYLWVYSHADAYNLEGLVNKKGEDVFGGCQRHIKDIVFYMDKYGKLYLEVNGLNGKTKYVDLDGNPKPLLTKLKKLEK